MLRFVYLLSLVVLLGACQTTQGQRDFDSSRDFTLYRDWSWSEPAVSYRPADDPRITSDLTTQRIQDAVSAQLDARGLRPSNDGDPDVLVKVYMIVEQRHDNVTTHYGGAHYWRWGMMGPMMSESRTVTYDVATMQIDMTDASDGKLVWRGSTSEVLNSRQRSPTDRTQSTHEMARQVLEGYPPY
ncbi:DUF4136 domain-containing protein [Pseudomonas saliphila]|uniref:DUF4136 domain-containing protein n=1 Tax=Pseudomonas saliphila TaxID=2586906 RepID=UPI00123B127B|nr:DUF4136 domain-containing protein [Pseudomonas saliphila]